MIYFDNAATGGKKPYEVLFAVKNTLVQCANPGRSGHRLSISLAEHIYRTRKRISDYFDGYGEERVIFTKNCTEALNTMIFSIKGHIVTTELEHNSVLRPLYARGNYSICPLKDGILQTSDLLSLVREDTKAVVLSLASNVTGYAPNIEEIKRGLPDHVLLLCDGAQYGGHLPLSLKKSGIDGIAFAGHKGLLGVQGSGILLFSPRFSPDPLTFGGTGTESENPAMPDVYPERLEAGTLNYPAIISLHEGIMHLQASGEHNFTKHTAFLLDRLTSLPLTIYSKPNPFGIVSFASPKFSSEELASLLSDREIAVRGGLHCAPLIHNAIDKIEGGSVRVSFGYQNTFREIEEFVAILKKIIA